MSMYEIQGGRPLGGRLRVQGAKNSVLPLLAAALLAPGQSVIHNCPDLSDVSATLDILALLGCRVAREGETVTVDAAALSGSAIPERLMREMRSSVIFWGRCWPVPGAPDCAIPEAVSWVPGPSICTWPPCGGWERRSERMESALPAPRAADCGGRGSICPFPVWGPPRTPCCAPAELRG